MGGERRKEVGSGSEQRIVEGGRESGSSGLGKGKG